MKLTARALSGEVCDIEVEYGRFSAVTARNEDIPDLPWIAPGLTDIQINGFGGVDFNRALESAEAWQEATGQLYAHGCTGFLIALITNTEEGYGERLRELTEHIRDDPRNCLGFHMEGPWLNPDPGHRGAHRAEWMQKPSVRLLEEWRGIAGELIRLITIAPEIDPQTSIEVIRAGTKEGIRFFLGHSGTGRDLLSEAHHSGAVGWTHLGNAVPASVPKFDNVIINVLAESDLLASLIPDGVHVPSHAFRALARALGPRLLLTTDAMAAAGASRGSRGFTLGAIEVLLGNDGCARLPDSGRLAGSTLTPYDGACRAKEMADISFEQAWTAFSTRPTEMLGLSRKLKPGDPADFCLISPLVMPQLVATYHHGECVFKAR